MTDPTNPPSDDDRDAFIAELTARLASPSSHASLSPAVRSVVTETLDPDSRTESSSRSRSRFPSPSPSPSLSVPIALVRATAATGDDDESPRTDASTAGAPSRATLLEVCTSLAFLDGYARLRQDILGAARATDRDRDVAILASDYLHAAAHATLAGISISGDRHVALYRTLTAGSAALATSFLERSGTLESVAYSYSDSNPNPNLNSNSNPNPNPNSNSGSPSHASEKREHALAPERPASTPTAVLAGTGSALGAAVVGSSRETLEAMRTYGESLVAAIDAVSESSDADGAGVGDHDHVTTLETVEQVLLGRRTEPNATAPSADSPSHPASVPDSSDSEPTAVEAHLERARSALDRLPETAPRERLEAATLVAGRAVDPGRRSN
ncbi:hypothetical protein [Halomontanus rarus]|uniref:hypothetical protein n=1 Tax=Halomontanus rarus TaxID=3034020 RepID=UPI0023E8DD13|nr:hypothetical protein [Halovivax sp. TS33]